MLRMGFYRENQMSLFVFCSFLIKTIFAVSSAHHFVISEKNVRVTDGIIETMQVKSVVECAVMCARNDRCNGFNYGIQSLCEPLEITLEIKANRISSAPNYNYYTLLETFENTYEATTTKSTKLTKATKITKATTRKATTTKVTTMTTTSPTTTMTTTSPTTTMTTTSPTTTMTTTSPTTTMTTRPTTTATASIGVIESSKGHWKVLYTGDYKVVPSTQCDSTGCIKETTTFDKVENACATNFGLHAAVLNNLDRHNYVSTNVAENTNCPPYCIHWIGMSGVSKRTVSSTGKDTYVYTWTWQDKSDTTFQVWDVGQPLFVYGNHYVFLNVSTLLWGTTVNINLNLPYICSSNVGL